MLKYKKYIKKSILNKLRFGTSLSDYKRNKLISFIKNREIVWHFCTPKCASTSFLYNVRRYQS